MAAYSSILAKLAVKFTADTLELGKGVNKANSHLASLQAQAAATNKTLNTFAGGLGAFYVATKVFDGFAYAIKIIADFERQMDVVRAVTGATGDEFKKLEHNARSLGAATEWSAKQVAELQTEYAKLGFSTEEILNSTKATLNLATATGSDLARATEIAGSTLRAFHIDASEMGRVTDVMTGAFNMSALALDSFADGIKYVAPVAHATNVTLEETSAMLGVLADNGIKGSLAGTALRRIFTELSKDGRPLLERLQELADAGLTLADSNTEVGIYAQTALLVLASQNDKVKELTTSLQNVNGVAQQTSDIMRDNLTGDVNKFTAELDAAILRGSAFLGVLRDIVNFGRELIGGRRLETAILDIAWEDNIEDAKKYIDILRQVASETGKITITDVEIEKLFPAGIDFEKLVLVRKAINLVNAELEQTARASKAADNELRALAGKLIDAYGSVDGAIQGIQNRLNGPLFNTFQNFNDLTSDQVYQQQHLNLVEGKEIEILKILNDLKVEAAKAKAADINVMKTEYHTIKEVNEGLKYYGDLLDDTDQRNIIEVRRIQTIIDRLIKLKQAYESAGNAAFQSIVDTEFIEQVKARKYFNKNLSTKDPFLGEQTTPVTSISIPKSQTPDKLSDKFSPDAAFQKQIDASNAYLKYLEINSINYSKYVEDIEKYNERLIASFAAMGVQTTASMAYAFGHGDDMGQKFLESLSKFMMQFSEALIAIGVANIAAENYAKGAIQIAAGIALGVAAGAVAKSVEKSGGQSGEQAAVGGGGRTRGVGMYQTERRTIIELRAKGSDLVAVYDSAKYDNYYRKTGG